MGNINVHRNHRGHSFDHHHQTSASSYSIRSIPPLSSTKKTTAKNASVSSPELDSLSKRGRFKRLVKSLKRSGLGSPSSVTSPDNGMDVSTAISTITSSSTVQTTTNTTITAGNTSHHDSIGIEANELMLLLKDEIGWNLFFEFCTKEYSVENCLCLQEIQTLQNKITRMNGKKRRESCKALQRKYFSGESIQQVNVSGRSRQLIKSIANSKVIDLDTANELLIQLRKEVVMNLRDTYSRFVLTDDYADWKEMVLNPESIFKE